jgi:hypothetical protein
MYRLIEAHVKYFIVVVVLTLCHRNVFTELSAGTYSAFNDRGNLAAAQSGHDISHGLLL